MNINAIRANKQHMALSAIKDNFLFCNTIFIAIPLRDILVNICIGQIIFE